jgi:hypothetical protein
MTKILGKKKEKVAKIKCLFVLSYCDRDEFEFGK